MIKSFKRFLLRVAIKWFIRKFNLKPIDPAKVIKITDSDLFKIFQEFIKKYFHIIITPEYFGLSRKYFMSELPHVLVDSDIQTYKTPLDPVIEDNSYFVYDINAFRS